MKFFVVSKCDSRGNVTNYGQMCEEDMKLVTKGYKKDNVISNMYSRKGSYYFFIVEKVK